MQGQHKRLPDSGNGKHISPLSPFPPVQSQTHEPTEETEKGKQRLGKQKTETEGGKAGVEQEETEETETDGRLTNARPQVLGESAIIVIVLLEGSQGLVEGVPGDHLEHVHQPFVPTVQAHFVRTGSEFVCFVCFVVSVGAVPFLLPVFPSSLFFCIPWLAISGPGAFKVQGSRFEVQGSRFKVQGSRFKVQGSGFKVQGSRFKVRGSRFKVQGSRFRVQGSRFRVQGSRFKVQGSRFEVQGSRFRRSKGVPAYHYSALLSPLSPLSPFPPVQSQTAQPSRHKRSRMPSRRSRMRTPRHSMRLPRKASSQIAVWRMSLSGMIQA